MVWEKCAGSLLQRRAERRDFRIVLEEIVRVKCGSVYVPGPYPWPWQSAGRILLGTDFSLAWRCLDAQYWGVSPRDARGSSLSRILQGAPPTKYYLTPRACLGILRRAFERGKALPKKLERALKIQAGLALPDGQITDIDAYHINQRDEGIDLQGVSGALMATSNMQMQTFVTQASENTEGFDGYNGDLTGDVAATLGVNCGMSTGRNGVIAFAANQRDEVRDLHDVAGALNAQPGIKQQTFVAGFSAGAGASAGSIGYHESVAPTLKAGASGNCMPSVLCINDQGGQIMEISEGMTGNTAGAGSTAISRWCMKTTALMPATGRWRRLRLPCRPAMGRAETMYRWWSRNL